jgi:phosphoribosylaminoimidazole-succinocarboxamide synthase
VPPLTQGSLAGLAHRHLHSGKVRELFGVGDDEVLIVATDRISAFDHVLPTEIPDKGAILTAMTLWWFDRLTDLVPHHLITADVERFPAELAAYSDALRGRAMLCRRLEMVPVECVARGYLAGSGFADYTRTGQVCGHPLPPGLRDGDRLPEPIFTPATKAEHGEHDENVTREQVATTVGAELAAELERLTLDLYRRAAALAEPAGVLLADTKVEFGRDPATGELVLGDEVLTPDSSRFWPASSWQPGGAQVSWDKQQLRDWLVGESGWDRQGPPPSLPDHIVERTRAHYVEAYETLTGASFGDHLGRA